MKLYVSGAKAPFNHQSFEQITDTPFSVDDIKLMSCGSNHIVVVTTNNQIFAAGENNYGQLGIGTSSSSTSGFVRCVKQLDVHNSSSSSIGSSMNIEQLICGMHSTAIIVKCNDETQLWVCGNNEHGLLALGSSYSTSLFIPVFTRVKLPDHCNGIKQYSMGCDHCMLLDESNQLFGSGLNDCGQLSRVVEDHEKEQRTEFDSFQKVELPFSSSSIRVKQVSCGYRHTLLLTESNEVYACGDNRCGQLGIVIGNVHQLNSLTKTKIFATKLDPCRRIGIKQIFAGWYHSSVLLENGVLYSCGSNSHGEIGDNELAETNFEQFRQVNLLASNIVINELCMSCPTGSTMAMLSDGHTVVASGINHYYQLGLGDKKHRNDLTKVPMSHFLDTEHDTLVRVIHGARITAALTVVNSTSLA